MIRLEWRDMPGATCTLFEPEVVTMGRLICLLTERLFLVTSIVYRAFYLLTKIVYKMVNLRTKAALKSHSLGLVIGILRLHLLPFISPLMLDGDSSSSHRFKCWKLSRPHVTWGLVIVASVKGAVV
eukprot:TRINITY_DN3913_c0_g1_i3.p1 TRINITY_DN3913_c0_g1~~TRINITY_DN3913_c0_g1_i3.p1  ORF type:complete len:126 (+),score=9.54 TRINITY_DN3913_c0_g1_i3:30-407(+)